MDATKKILNWPTPLPSLFPSSSLTPAQREGKAARERGGAGERREDGGDEAAMASPSPVVNELFS
jgi:hypothetical protein